MNPRDRLLVAVLSIALVLLSGAALAPSLESAGDDEGPSATIPASRGYVEGVLGRGTHASPFSARSPADRALVALLFRGLVRLGPGGAILPDLASSWEVDPAGRTWTFHLRRDLAWQDDEPITADDVVFTVSVLSHPDYIGPGAESWRDVTATAIDPQTVSLTLTTPLGGFLQAATQPIAPAHLLDEVPPEALPDDPFGTIGGTPPVGSGAFRVVFMDEAHVLLAPSTPLGITARDGGRPDFMTPRPSDSLAVPPPTRRPETPVPYLSSIEFRYYDDVAALRNDWDEGAFDAVSGLLPGDAASFARSPGARLVRYPGTTLLAAVLDLRAKRTEFQDPAVRRALLTAIDRDSIVSGPLARLGQRADSLIAPSSAMFDSSASPAIAFDAAAARRALTDAGWKESGGSWIPKGATDPLLIELLSPEELANPVAYAAASAVVDAWHGIGLAVRQVPLPATELLGRRLGPGAFQVAVVPLAIGLDPDVYPLLAASQTRTGGSNLSGLQDVALDKLLEAARAAVDEGERTAAYAALQTNLAVGSYILPLAFRDDYVVLRDWVIGPTPRPVGSSGDRFWDVLTWRLADGRQR
jgi:peptide/nickel transport system substrate-binding protein